MADNIHLQDVWIASRLQSRYGQTEPMMDVPQEESDANKLRTTKSPLLQYVVFEMINLTWPFLNRRARVTREGPTTTCGIYDVGEGWTMELIHS